MKGKKLFLSLCLLGVFTVFNKSSWATTLTSLTLEGVLGNGSWMNAPGGIWSTNLGDSFTQAGVTRSGGFINQPGNGLDLGEVAVQLQPGLNTFVIYGTSYGGGFDYYGIDLYFNGNGSPPNIAVYNARAAAAGSYTVTPAGTYVAGSANGGSVPDIAPGSAVFSDPDGSFVRLLGFSTTYSLSNPDVVSWGTIAADGRVDTLGYLTLEFTPAPVPEPCSMLLLGAGMAALAACRKRMGGKT